ncbi:Apyrase [Oesophagostomum dentatum]|uniref:Apyrase n=1 Tax=Oesophagostomum dentatum TaxID=61180 RepID=A0A0B1T3Z2_OESDE|nr:Apyrase [Oesophagostomum dentatum]
MREAIPWVFLNSGPGNTTQGMKAEWLTIKDGLLYAGGHGAEYRNKEGKVISEDPMWIKTISKSGEVKSIYWKEVYDKLRNATGYPAPGYLTHEAVQWSDTLNMWLFLPRKASKTLYEEEKDEKKGARLLILASEDFQDIYVVKIGKKYDLDRSKGFSAFDFIPRTGDTVFVALKSVEVGNETASFVTVFDIRGRVILPDQRLDGNYKFEAIYFV